MNAMIIGLAVLLATELVAVPGPVKRSATEKVLITNATPDLLIFTLIPTKLSLTNRYNDRYGDYVEYFVHELLPGQNIEIYNLERSLTDYDRVLWVVPGDQRAALDSSMMAGNQRDKKRVFVIPIGGAKKVFIEKKGKEFVLAKDSVRINQLANDYFSAGNAFANKACNQSQRRTVKE